MKLIALIIVVIVVLSAGYSGIVFWRSVQISKALVSAATPYSLQGSGRKTLLLLGDSTAVGVGASSPTSTLAALVATAIHATDVENRAVSGARVADLQNEIHTAKSSHYDYILIGIGANDIVRFKSADSAAAILAASLKQLPEHSHLVLYTAGNVGATQIFPRVLNPQYTARTLAYHRAFARVVSSAGGAYVNLYIDPARDPFELHPEIYLAADGFHPSSAGYAVWFEKLRTVLQ